MRSRGVTHDRLCGRASDLVLEPERATVVADEHGFVDRRGAFGTPDAVRKIREHRGRDMKGEPCLAGAAGTSQRHQPVIGEQLAYIGELDVASDEARQLQRKVVRKRIQRSQRGNSVPTPG